jgi:hypothetical protein
MDGKESGWSVSITRTRYAGREVDRTTTAIGYGPSSPMSTGTRLRYSPILWSAVDAVLRERGVIS